MWKACCVTKNRKTKKAETEYKVLVITNQALAKCITYCHVIHAFLLEVLMYLWAMYHSPLKNPFLLWLPNIVGNSTTIWCFNIEISMWINIKEGQKKSGWQILIVFMLLKKQSCSCVFLRYVHTYQVRRIYV